MSIQKTWDLKSAAKRLTYRLSKKDGQYKRFKPAYEDIKALKCLIDYIDRVNEQSLVKNPLFAKLFIFQLNQSIRYHKSCVLNNEIQNDLSKVLDQPLELQYQEFIQGFQNNQLEFLVENNKPLDKEYLNRIYTDDVIKGFLNEMITNALNRF